MILCVWSNTFIKIVSYEENIILIQEWNLNMNEMFTQLEEKKPLYIFRF